MMKTRFFYLLAAAVSSAGLTGCSLEEVVSAPETQINISAHIASLSKAPSLNDSGSGMFASGDVFTLQIAGSQSQSSSIDYQVGSTNLYWKDVPAATEGGVVGFYACYPKQTALSGNTFSFDVSQAEEPDLLLAKTENVTVGTTDVVSLTFGHVMHRLVVNFKTDPSYISVGQMVLGCTAKSACTVDLVKGTVTSTDKTAKFTASGASATFLLVPQNASDVTLEVQAGNDVKTVALQDLVSNVGELESGKQLTLDLTVKEGAIQLDNVTISGWGNQGTIDGEVIM